MISTVKKSPLDEVALLLPKKSGKKQKSLVDFMYQLLENTSHGDLEQLGTKTLASLADDFYHFAQQRKAGEEKVKAFIPDAKRFPNLANSTVIEVVHDDMPFLVDSLTSELQRHDLTIRLTIHPVIKIERTAGGAVQKILDRRNALEKDHFESCIVIVLAETLSNKKLDDIKSNIVKVLKDVQKSVRDWAAMRSRVLEAEYMVEQNALLNSDKDRDEVVEFLRWLSNDHFTFLGYRDYTFSKAKADPDLISSLGFLSDTHRRLFKGNSDFLSPQCQIGKKCTLSDVLMITKTICRSTVHRNAPMDVIRLKKFDESGNVIGEIQFVGLFTSTAYNRSPRDIPLLRRKVRQVLKKSSFSPQWHDGKALIHILESLPRDELFQMTNENLYEVSIAILHLQERQRLSLFVREDPFEHFISCLIYVPQDRYNSELREKMQEILEAAFQGPISFWQSQLGDLPYARVHFIITLSPGALPKYDTKELEQKLFQASLSWKDLLKEQFIETFSAGTGREYFRHFAKAFPVPYQSRYGAQTATEDALRIDEISADAPLSIKLVSPSEATKPELHAKLYHHDQALPLAAVLPLFESMGLKVLNETSFKILPKERLSPVWIHDFEISLERLELKDTLKVSALFEDCFLKIHQGVVENDQFNALVFKSESPWHNIVILRAYAKYLRQLGVPYSQSYIEEALIHQPNIVKKLVDLFYLRFDPEMQKIKTRESKEKNLVSSITKALDEVKSLDEDRILRSYLNLITSTLRTNYFQRKIEEQKENVLSFKIHAAKIFDMPEPRPEYEIFMYSPRMEAVHLRGGKIARGGIRWSDRREDFRTEILGLMKAQMVKNTVIVPTGAKGGFIVKTTKNGKTRDEFLQEGIACYQQMIRGILDITDNIKSGKAVPPQKVVIYDEDDPYLVVAADKGTATFSDIANEISAEYNFWLGDAFASGGTSGYDHKNMGITARGAWESVKRHFQELNTNIETTDFAVVGIGDMAGDVFGNGMLCSSHIKLIGAFNHQHIFLDPNPDASKSFAERQRLFKLPRSSWEDYNSKLISKGGGVFSRQAKAIKLSKETKALLGIAHDSLSPNELIKALLKASYDLLWFGGIGTFIKSSDEKNSDAGDRSNDGLRVNAKDLNCRIIGEGANLGITQKGRIEFALAGGKINTDFIDNSAGVDCSDHEVNLKIFMKQLIDQKVLSPAKRNTLLAQIEPNVASLVLRDNYLQTQIISIIESQGIKILGQQARFMRNLERMQILNRELEFLPNDDIIAERFAHGIGFTRPEIAVLLSYSKISLKIKLMESSSTEDSHFLSNLYDYFPKKIQEKYKKQMMNHPLKREIILTQVINEMVNRTGFAFVTDMVEQSGAKIRDVLKSYTIVCSIFDLNSHWESIEKLDNKVNAETQTQMQMEVVHFLRLSVLWFLRHKRFNIQDEIKAFSEGIMSLSSNMTKYVTKSDYELNLEESKNYISCSVPKQLAQKIAFMNFLPFSLYIVQISKECTISIESIARTYFYVGEFFGFNWLRDEADNLISENYWQKISISALVDELSKCQSKLTKAILQYCQKSQKGCPNINKPEVVVDHWVQNHSNIYTQLDQLLNDFKTHNVDISMLFVAVRQLNEFLKLPTTYPRNP
ncbi:MAG: NAD-glutamate dehydrogenase [Alphaproteobacteria bacterium]|jgi:glutamate dehydrogenase|nr:NAD-glutamate dehydrogenase [Alphaproteobacteria bacterium]MBT5390583.1 NAD-glutamate dehydrogenase [Alphaproteobacteria bacterium]MBT5540595.1 NAD-glutamate dehydrogenase [Alphaproteobacteria bacterium]MBT5655049.1 NAD-glutamate dehydrogenase [Alphaproteobacteria bacterium]